MEQHLSTDELEKLNAAKAEVLSKLSPLHRDMLLMLSDFASGVQGDQPVGMEVRMALPGGVVHFGRVGTMPVISLENELQAGPVTITKRRLN